MFIVLGVFGISQIALAQSAFPDVDEDHPYKSAIEYLKENAVISGYPDGTFKPGKTVNRAELLKILIEGSGYEAPEVTESCFSDVPADKWFSKYVCYAKQKGWVKGYADGKFRPEQTVNKVEALKMMGEIQDWQVAEVNSTKFQDADYSDWYGSYLMYAEAKGLIPEADSGTFFSPGAEMSRAAIAENIFRSAAVKQLKKLEFNEDTKMEFITQKLLKLSDIVTPQIVINEVQYGYDTYGWVELYNAGSKEVDITNWSLTNGEAQKFATFPQLTMPPGSYLVVYLDHGMNDLYLEDGYGEYYLNRTEGLFNYQKDAIALFDSEDISADSMIDFVNYCNDSTCPNGITHQMAVNSKNWREGDFVYTLMSSAETLTIGRDMYSNDSNTSLDWSYDSGIEEFDQVLTAPYDEENPLFFDLEFDPDSVASISLMAKSHCDYTEVLKKALQMMKDSCGFDEFSESIGGTENGEGVKEGGVNIDEITPKTDKKGKKTQDYDLTDNITVHLGKSSSHTKGQTHVPPTIDGKVDIEINLEEVDCDPEKMKAVLYHELQHEKQVRETGNGIWGKDGKRQQPVSKNPRNGTNSIDPFTMIADCMEVETHLKTAQCLQKEKMLPEFAEHTKSIDYMLEKSKNLAEQYWKSGPPPSDKDAHPARKGCFEYLDSIKNDTDTKKDGTKVKIKNQQWLAENEKIRQAYVNNWIQKMRNLIHIIYEKYYDPGDGASEKDLERAKARFKEFLRRQFWVPAEELDEFVRTTIEKWKALKASWEEASGLIQDSPGSDNSEEAEEIPEWEIPDADGILVPRENENPSAFISPASPTCKAGEIIYLSGEESYDSDGYIEEFNWYLNGNTLYSTNISTGVECLNVGSLISLELRVIDDYGATASKTISITVEEPAVTDDSEDTPSDQPAENQPPVASIYPASPTCNSGDTLEIFASESYDPDGTITNWEWYDGSMLYSTGQSMQYDCMLMGFTKKMELRLTDDDGVTTIKSFNIVTN